LSLGIHSLKQQMAALALKGLLRGPSFTAAGLPGRQNPPPHSRFRDHWSSAIPSLAWSMGGARRDTKLKAQVSVVAPQMLSFS
jgi:hypothetical protein